MARMKTEEKSKAVKSEPGSTNGVSPKPAKKVNSALAQIASYYSSDEDEKRPEKPVKKSITEDDLVKLHRERKERIKKEAENRKRKFNLSGNYFGMGKVSVIIFYIF